MISEIPDIYYWQVLERYYPETAINSPSVGRIGKSRRRRQARQSAMELLSDNTSKDASQAETNDVLESVLDVTCIGASSSHALEDPPETCGLSNICNLDKASRPEQGETSSMLEFETNSLEQQATRFEEYALPALERLHLPPLPSSLLKSIWREMAPYQVCITMSKALLT